MKRELLFKFFGTLAGIFVLFYSFSFYKCYFSGWPIVKKLCIEPNGGNASYVDGSYWGAGDGKCTITFKQGDTLVSYRVNLDNKTATLLTNSSTSQADKYEAIF